MKSLITAVVAVVFAGVFAGTSLASLIATGTVPYTYSNGTGTGTVEYWGYTSPGNPIASDYPETFGAGSVSEWTYQVADSTGDFTRLNLHLGNAESSVLYIENPDSPAGSEFLASTCTPTTPCMTANWKVEVDPFGTITWVALGRGITADNTVGLFEYYSKLPLSANYSLSVGDSGETDISVGGPSVSEPSTILLLGSGLLGISFWARKRFGAGAR